MRSSTGIPEVYLALCYTVIIECTLINFFNSVYSVRFTCLLNITSFLSLFPFPAFVVTS